ncbi:DUF4158 domain-containing protein [Streptomyces cellulosae]
MATRVFSDEELEALRSFPAIGKDELIRYFTLPAADEAFLRKFLRPQTVLGTAVQLCTLAVFPHRPRQPPHRERSRHAESYPVLAGEPRRRSGRPSPLPWGGRPMTGWRPSTADARKMLRGYRLLASRVKMVQCQESPR